MNVPRPHALAVLLLAAVLPLGGCGGGGDDSTDIPPATAGRVAVLLTDASTDDFSSISITVTRVELLSADLGSQVIWEGSETVDLLGLSATSDLFAVGQDVPAGLYDKIRLHVAPDSLAFIPAADFRLPGDKIDLNPRGKFAVGPGDALVVLLDFDAAKSLAVSNGGVFRPVVFVDVVDGSAGTQRLTRVRGQVSRVDETSVEICHPSLARPDYCVTAALGADTSVYRADADGMLARTAPEAGDADGFAVAYGYVLAPTTMDAVVLELGDGFLVKPLRGTVDSVSEEEIVLLPKDEPADPVSPVSADYGLARFFRCSGEELAEEEQTLPALSDVLTGEQVRMDGLYDDPGRTLQATIGIVASCDGASHLAGTVEGVEAGAHHQIWVGTGGEGPICAQFRDRVRIMAGATKGPDTYDLSPADFSDLGAGAAIHLFGSYLEGEQCFQVEAAVLGTGGTE